jgi:hypothetical protein
VFSNRSRWTSDMTPKPSPVSLQWISRNTHSLSNEPLKWKNLLTMQPHVSINDTMTDRSDLMKACGFEPYRSTSSSGTRSRYWNRSMTRE